MFELAVLKHAETSMRSEFVVIRRSISELQYELDTLKERFSVK